MCFVAAREGHMVRICLRYGHVLYHSVYDGCHRVSLKLVFVL